MTSMHGVLPPNVIASGTGLLSRYAFTLGQGPSGVPLRTISAPVINNRSLYVDPRRHCYRYRHEEKYPPLVPGLG